ncbi:acyl-CoA dehydrogenase family protein [Mesorhizobium sp. M0589]|uniref:acyl-CoA dehydrogenase family protein n=1 Tax=Mesorhizobium sp. M0589 TaxID=2956965 RepID=UPI003339B98D
MVGDDKRLWEIAEAVGTPFYLFDAALLRARYAALKTTFPSVAFFYSLKANPNLSVVRELVRAGMGCEVCSMLELETAIAAGAPAQQTLFVGPAKSGAELRQCVSEGIKAVVVESGEELRQLEAIAGEHGKIQTVALRINPDFQFPGAKLNMSGKASQFGIDQSTLSNVLRDAAAYGHVRIVGLHVYMGTRILDHMAIVSNSRHILSLADDVRDHLRYPLQFVDIGGGFGVPYYEGEAELDLCALGQDLNPVLAAYEHANPQTRICIELGRYMVASAGRFVVSVRQQKTMKGENFAICDGGSNINSAASGNGVLMRKNFPMTLLRKHPESDAAKGNWTLTGPLCTPMDIIGKDVPMMSPSAGDLVCIHQSGAYGATASPVNFLGFGQPAEVMIDGDRLTLVRQRASNAIILADQTPRSLTPAPAFIRSASESNVFDHPCLAKLDALRPLLVATGARLENDPEAWRDLWTNPLLRALTLIGVPARHNCFPIEQAGLDLDGCSYALQIAMIERIARADASCILALQGPSLSGGVVQKMGTPEQIERFFRAYQRGPQGTFFAVTEPTGGSDPSQGNSHLCDKAGTLRLNAHKMIVGNVERAAVGLLFARDERSGRPVLVMIDRECHARHLTIERLPTFGLHGADLCRLMVEDLPVQPDMILGDGRPSLQDGFVAINDVFERNRPIVAALALGTGRGILDYLSEATHGVEPRLADLRLRHAALLRRLDRVLAAYEAGRPKTQEISLIKLQAVAFADQVVERAFSLDCSAQLMMDPVLRRKTRDAKAFEYMEGTTNIHVLNAFRSYVSGVPHEHVH